MNIFLNSSFLADKLLPNRDFRDDRMPLELEVFVLNNEELDCEDASDFVGGGRSCSPLITKSINDVEEKLSLLSTTNDIT